MNLVKSESLHCHMEADRGPNSKLSAAFIFLIIVQSYLVPLIGIVSGTDYNKYTNYVYLHTVLSYTVIAVSIIMFHDDGLEVFQDHFSLWLIVATCFFRASMGGNNEIIYKGILFLLGLVLLNYIITNRRSIRTPSLKSVVVGLLWAAGTTMAAALPGAFFDPKHGTLPSHLAIYLINESVYQLSFVVVIEEAYFRGLLFGLLVMRGYKENTALLVQAILFWGMHYMKIGDPVLFFGVVPIGTFFLTLIIKKYKMLYLSIMVHLINNVFGGILAALL